MGCGNSNSGGKLALLNLKMNELQGNFCSFWFDIAWGQQKLGIVLENKVPLNLKFTKHIINKVVCLPKNEKKVIFIIVIKFYGNTKGKLC